MKTRLLALAALCVVACAKPVATAPAKSRPHSSAQQASPRLVVQITVDQLRADLPLRLRARYGAGGFRRLLDSGVVYANAHYAHAITETAVGHATLFTGALPKVHGIVGNEWFDPVARKTVFAVDDPQYPQLGSTTAALSPRALLAPTVGDLLVEHTRGKALVRSVSAKDRGAILPAGQRGTAYWLDNASGHFVTSRFYMDALPPWLAAFNARAPAERYRGSEWTLLEAPGRYVATDDHDWERGYGSLGRAFPHGIVASSTEQLVKTLKYTPVGDELVLALVEAMLGAEPLGRDEVPDLLAISFSSTDYVGHAFGPESRESEDNLLRLDRTLAALFALLDRTVAEDRWLVVLSADHGVDESPEYWHAKGQPAGRIDPDSFLRALNARLKRELAVSDDLIAAFVYPSLWLDEARVRERGLELDSVARKLAQLATEQPEIHAAFARTDVLLGKLPDDAVTRRVAASVHPTRSGHVDLVLKPHWLVAAESDTLTASHGTPWDYDTHVPIIVMGPGVRAQVVERAVDPRDIAPTLAERLGLPALVASSGQPLREALPAKSKR